jgi:hypothetical protein
MVILRLAFLIVSLAVAAPISAAEPDWQAVAKALGNEGAIQGGGVYRIGLPRSDLKVMLDGVFMPMGNEAMVMGDLVLTGDEVSPVMKKFLESGIDVTALHNHLLRSEPMTMYMHVAARGDPVKLATALHDGLALSKTPMGATPAAAAQSVDLDTNAIDAAMGYKGKAAGAIYQFSIPRAAPVEDEGMTLPEAMGSANAINFQGTGDGKAAITGDLVLVASEVNPVLRALRSNGIEVTALHSHMIDDQPHLFFMHFWAHDDAVKLSKGMRAALDKVALKKS